MGTFPVGMVVTSTGMPSEGSGVSQDLTCGINAGSQRGRSVGMDPPDGACLAAAGKCEENQHPDVKPTGFVTTLSGQILVLSQSMEALSGISGWLCSFLDKRL